MKTLLRDNYSLIATLTRQTRMSRFYGAQWVANSTTKWMKDCWQRCRSIRIYTTCLKNRIKMAILLRNRGWQSLNTLEVTGRVARRGGNTSAIRTHENEGQATHQVDVDGGSIRIFCPSWIPIFGTENLRKTFIRKFWRLRFLLLLIIRLLLGYKT